MCENHYVVNDYCSKHVLDSCYMNRYVCMSKSMQVIVLKTGFESNCGFLWILENWWWFHEFNDWICVLKCFECSFEVPRTGCSLGEQVLRHGERVLSNTCFARSDPLGCFQTSLNVPYVLFWCSFEELSVGNHVFLKLNELYVFRQTLNIHELDFWKEIEVRFFPNEMLLLWFNYCDNECRRSM